MTNYDQTARVQNLNMTQNFSTHAHVHNGIVECRHRLRRYRATRKRDGCDSDGTQLSKSDSRSIAVNIDRSAARRAHCEVKGEADVK